MRGTFQVPAQRKGERKEIKETKAHHWRQVGAVAGGHDGEVEGEALLVLLSALRLRFLVVPLGACVQRQQIDQSAEL